MIVYTALLTLNFLRAPFSLKEPLNLLDYDKLDWRKLENIKIRWLLIGQAAALSKSGSGLIGQVAA